MSQSDADVTGRTSQVRNLSSLLSSLIEKTEGETVTVQQLLEAVGRRAYGPILTLLGFVAIGPLTLVPFTTSLFALVILLISLQMAFGKRYPWVPGRILRMEFPRQALVNGIKSAQGWVRPIDALLAPRFTFLTEPPFAMLIALVGVAAALVTFPLSLVPIAPVVPCLAVLLFGLGVTARDGVLIMLAGTALFGAILLVFRIWNRVSEFAVNVWPF
jgi:hypothetical protein